MATDSPKRIGTAPTVLVCPGGNRQNSLVTAIIVKATKETAAQRLRFTGVVGFSLQVREHLETSLLPIVDQITTSLHLPLPAYEISAVNVSLVSMGDTGFEIEGFSADCSLFISLLSAALDLPIDQRLLTTGHIASIAGDITAVGALPAKIKAASAEVTIETLIYPDLCRQIDENLSALNRVCDDLKLKGVSDIGQLVASVFSEEDLLISSLRQGYYAQAKEKTPSSGPIERVVDHLLTSNPTRFESVLRSALSAGRTESAQELLRTFIDNQRRAGRYPEHFGRMLLNILCAIAPAVRQRDTFFPLIETGLCIKLAGLARERDYEDVLILLDAAGGRHLNTLPQRIDSERSSRLEDLNEEDERFEQILSQINEQAFAKKYGIKIDSARASFVLNSVTVASYPEFIETVVSFYRHLRCYLHKIPVESTETDFFRSEALELLATAYEKEGGESAAWQKALEGIAGGMRLILDRLTEEYKRQQQEKDIRRVFTESLNRLDWNDRVKVMRSAMKRLHRFLPAEMADQPPERFARNYEVIIKTYVKNRDQFNQLISRF